MRSPLTRYTALFVAVLCTAFAVAQDSGDAAIRFLQKHHTQFELQPEDVDQVEITDNYASPDGTRHVYLRQLHNGTPVFNAQAILHLRGENVIYQTIDLIPGLEERVNSLTPVLDVTDALLAASEGMTTSSFSRPVLSGRDGRDFLFSWSEVSRDPIRVSTVYFPREREEDVRLAYQVVIDQNNSSDHWVMVVDAENGDQLKKLNLTLYCDFGYETGHQHEYGNACSSAAPALKVDEQMVAAAVVADGARYRVFPFGIEAPLYGERELLTDPADPVFSPFGWHDTNGEEGAEFTHTRGNNVHAYLDLDASDAPNTDAVRAEGGDSLLFDFYFENGAQVDTLRRAALTQVFYMTNMVHDWSAAHGFDEAAGNFQAENYSGEGRDNDPVQAEAQDGGGTNNANFGTPADGGRPRMQMFIWQNNDPSVLEIIEPVDLAGSPATGLAQFGMPVGQVPLTGEIAVAVDDSPLPREVCGAVINVEEVTGKVAMIDRGECFFEQKVFNAQEAGAIAAIICNQDNSADGMAEAPNANLFDVTIPSVMLAEIDCAPLRAAALAGERVVVTFESTPPPADVDGDFDNGVVAHEIGHGISNRLVGGPSNASCLGSIEQMGEGWSDFFSLASSPKTLTDTPDGTELRGIGNYASGERITGRGIRRLPYTTDMSVNDHTYDAIITSGIPHPLGEIWATTLWDMYWVMVEEYGFDDDLINGEGGNNLAVRLVIEGLKFTKCNPGLLDGRDGILAADQSIYGGANSCLIWEAFARRGMGFSARQGSSNDQGDNIEAFDANPFCEKTVKFTKTSDVDVIAPGDGVTFEFDVRNDRDETATGIVITDVVPAGMTIDGNSVRGADDFTIDGQQITLRINELEPEDDTKIRYSVGTSSDLTSVIYYQDDAEDDDNNVEILSLEGDVFWGITEEDVFEGDAAFFIENVEGDQDQLLQIAEPVRIEGTNPALRFFTRYNTESGNDGGYVQVSTNGFNWENIDTKMIRNGYRGEIARNTFARSEIQAFWGDIDTWYTPDLLTNGYLEVIADLTEYQGQDLFVRFRFGSDELQGGAGWWIDNIQLIDLFNYETEATLSSDQGDSGTTNLGNSGIVVIGNMVDVVDPQLGLSSVSVFPNPADQEANVRITTERAGSARVELFSIDGRRALQQTVNLTPGRNQTTLNTANLPSGVYVVRVFGATQLSTTKLTVNLGLET